MNDASVKYAVALFSGDEERIMAVFGTKDEADEYGKKNKLPAEYGIQLCFSSMFMGNRPIGNSMCIYNYYNR